MRAWLGGLGLLLCSCGLFLQGGPPVPDYVAHPRTAYQLEGEVRDEKTLAPIPGATVILETGRPGYRLVRSSDAAGRFSVGYSAVERETTFADRLITGEQADARLVSRISVQVEAGARCSPVYTFDAGKLPEERVLLLVGDCAAYRTGAAER